MSTPCATDVHQPTTGRKKPRTYKEVEMDKTEKVNKVHTGATIVKLDDEQRLVYGWANVIEKDGETIVDHQGDVIDEPTLVKAAHAFMLNYRKSKEMHAGASVGDVVESVVFTPTLQKALGIDIGKTGWFIVVKVNDDDVWARVKKGELKAFSIGGTGRREELAKA